MVIDSMSTLEPNDSVVFVGDGIMSVELPSNEAED